MNKFYLTTAIPYVNGKPHIGHALEYFQADTVRRYQALLGKKTLLLSGADENALKNVQTAEKEGISTKELLDRNSQIFKNAFEQLGVTLDVFQRGSDKEKHWPGVQKLWELCDKNGDIYKKSYTGLYCVGCESFKTPEELIDGLCPDHKVKPEEVTEENYFFKLSTYQEKLIDLIESNKLEIIPANKRAETLAFIKSGLEDFSISRSKERAKGVGVPVPNDESQVMYVWFDALAIYLTGIGYGTDKKEFEEWWPADLHIIGKDINRFHTVYWPAMLLSAGLKTPKQVLIHSFILSGGQKMSKSLGNVIDPFDMVKKYGLEPFRYYLLSQIPIESDGDFTEERFKEVYTADLANGLGNLVARVAKLCEQDNINFQPKDSSFTPELTKAIEAYQFSTAFFQMWRFITELNQTINKEAAWKLEKEQRANSLLAYAQSLYEIGTWLQPFLPETAEKILRQFTGGIKSTTPLFPRLQKVI
jgi:methionyl-tRNA synthetase